MSASYDPNEIVPAGTILYPEIEALRYVIAEQKKEIEQLSNSLEYYIKQVKQLKSNEVFMEATIAGLTGVKLRTIQDNIDAGVYEDLSRAKGE